MRRHTPWCFGAGVILFHLLPRLPSTSWMLGPLLLALVALRAPRLRCLLPLALGFWWTWIVVDTRLAERWPVDSAMREVLVEGRVRGQPSFQDGTVQCVLDIDQLDGRKDSLRARLSWYEARVAPQAGERWRLRARLRAPRGFADPGAFDYEGWLFREGISATGYVVASGENTRVAKAGAHSLIAWRVRIAQQLDDIGGASTHVAVVSAVAVGLTGGLTERDWDIFRATGTSHLISISGLHIALVAGGVAWIVRRGWGRLPMLRRRAAPVDAAALAGLVAACGYALLAGFGIPTVRALIMLAAVLLRSLVRRDGPAESPLALAFAAVLLADPLAPLFPGFWLSFLAVAALMIAVMGGVRGVAAQLRTQWAVTLLVAPATLAVFQSLSMIAPLVNIVLIPVFSFLVVAPVLVGVVLLGISERVAAVPLSLAVGTLDFVWPWLERAAALPIALWMTAPRPLWVLLVAQLGLLLCVAPRGFPGRWLAWPLMLPLFAWRPAAPAQGDYEVAVLDVGQGLAVVVRTAHHALLYDAGPSFRGGGDTGRLVVVPYLRARGIRTLDAMVISHDDDDHAGGAASVRSLVRVGREITGGRGAGERCVAGRGWRWDAVDFALLHPRAGERWSDNDGSCVLRVSGRGGSVLLTGDIEQSGERALIDSGATLASDVVVAPHHGSASSSSALLVARTHARYVAFSAGFGNRWGFPKPAVQSRWRAAGATLHDTARSGALIYRVERRAGVQPPSRHRYDARHYWTSG